MAAKFLTLICLVAAAAAEEVQVAKLAYTEPSAPAQYEYSYSVHDTHSGDVKQQKENRQDDAVQGSYSLLQPDGTTRIVDYTADKEHGFNAVVRYEGHPTATPANIAYAAPAAKVAYAPAPIAKVAYAPASVQYAPAPIKYAPAPVKYAPAPFQYASAPVQYAPAPVQYASAPVKYAPAPVQYASAPVQYAPAPVQYAPASLQYAPAPVQYAPAPVQYASAPVQYAPAPVQYAPAPAQYASAPVQYAPAPTHYAQAPVTKVAYAAPAARVYTESLGHVTFSSPAVSYQH